ncbi:hypothetical protein ACKVMT_10275 [Halobacteriales archaeon Cl-PHB]
MTDVNEQALTAAKLREQVRGDLQGGESMHSFAGLLGDTDHATALSFVEDAVDGADDLDAANFRETELGRVVSRQVATDAADRAIADGDLDLMAHLVGVTEADLTADNLRVPVMLTEQLENNGAPAFITGSGNPETGKTNTLFLLVDLYDLSLEDDLLVLSNVRSWERSDIHVASAHDLAVKLLEHRDRPKAVAIDEGSTHFDARTHRREVATQFTPLAKRFAKIGVDVFGTSIHTGKDAHPEVKRLTTLAYWKHEKDVVEFYERWPDDASFPADQLLSGSIESLQETPHSYDPDDSAPWSWNLRPDLFGRDLSWAELLDKLRELGPQDT